MLKRCLIIYTFQLFSGLALFAQQDSNVVITQCKERYEIVWKSNDVQIKQQLSKLYHCNYYGVEVSVKEFYDDQIVINEVDFSVDGRKPGKEKPQYAYHHIDGYYYSDVKICSFNLPLKGAGSTGTVSFEKTILDPRFFTSIYFSDSYLTLHKEVNVVVPRWAKVELKEMNFDGYKIQKRVVSDEGNQADVYTYTINDLPVMANEINSPSPSYVEPHILVLVKEANFKGAHKTYFNSLADQYAWYRQLVGSIGTDTFAVKATALKITSGLTNDLAKIKAVFYWVQNHIRYIAFENGIAGFKPQRADEVIRRNYGDCKGMANATRELLKSLGYDARLCWIGTNDIAYDYSMPSLVVDNHMICALLFQGQIFFLDATETYLGWNEYAERIQGRQCLVEDGDNYLLTNIPSTTFDQNQDKEIKVLQINGANLTGKVLRVWTGQEKEYVFSQWNNTRKEKALEFLERHVAYNNSGYTVTDLATSDINNIDAALTASCLINYTNVVASFDNTLYIGLDVDRFFASGIIDTAKRKLDYWFPHKKSITRETELSIPNDYRVTALPSGLDVKNPNYEFNITCENRGDKVIYKKRLVIKNTRLPKSMFSQWNKDIAQLRARYNEQLVLTAK